MPAYFTKPLSQLTNKWQIFHEESVYLNPKDEKSDFEEIRGVSDSRIYRHGQEVLAVSSDNPRLQIKLRDLLGIPRNPKPGSLSPHSRNPNYGLTPTHLPRAKTGSVLLFPDPLLDTVAKAIKAKRKRPPMTEEQRAVLLARGSATRFGKTDGRKEAPTALETTNG